MVVSICGQVFLVVMVMDWWWTGGDLMVFGGQTDGDNSGAQNSIQYEAFGYSKIERERERERLMITI